MSVSEYLSPLVGRLVLVWFFLSQTLHYGGEWSATASLMTFSGIPAAPFVLLVALMLPVLGSLSLLFGYHTRHGAMLLFGVTIILITALVLAYTTGLLDRIMHRAGLSSRHPVSVLLTGVYDYFSIPPPDWLVRWASSAGLTPIERSFNVVFQSLRWLGYAPTPSQTPAEAAAVLLAQLPEVAGEIRSLTLEFEQALFSQKHTDLMLARHAGRMIRRQALRTAFRRRFSALRASLHHLVAPRSKE